MIPVEGTLSAPVVEWSAGTGPATATHPLTLSGVDGDHDLWVLTLTAGQVDEIWPLRAVRVAQPAPRRVVAAGLIEWRSGWSGECATRTAPLRVVGLPGPKGDPGPVVPLGALTDVDTTGAGPGQVLGFDGAGWAPVDQTGGGGGLSMIVDPDNPDLLIMSGDLVIVDPDNPDLILIGE